MQNGNFIGKLVFRPHKTDRFTGRDRLIERKSLISQANAASR